MVPMREPSARGRSRPWAEDSFDDDESWTVYSDTDSISSRATVSDDDFFPPRDRQGNVPVFRLGKGDRDKSVYEAWNIHYLPDRREPMNSFKVLGIELKHYEVLRSLAKVLPQPLLQSELAEMHLRGIEEFQAKNKRCWPARALRGKPKTYEDDLEERCRNLPMPVRTAITQLLTDKGKATSTRYRARTWTVVAMRGQLCQRFASTQFNEVKRHKLRFWKDSDPKEPLQYTVIIRGAETKAYDEDGVKTFRRFSNPWAEADSAEICAKSREQHLQRDALRWKRRELSPSYGAARGSSDSPPSYRFSRRRYASPSPLRQNSRSESPPPYRSNQRASRIRSRSPSLRIRVTPRFDRPADDFPAPTPPGSFTPPPAVSAAYGRAPMVPPSSPPAYGGPFAPRPPRASDFLRSPLRSAQFPPFGHGPSNPTPAPCLACRVSPPCLLPSFCGAYRTFPPGYMAPMPQPQPQPPRAPVISPLSTPPLSNASLSSVPTSGPHTPTQPAEIPAEGRQGPPRIVEDV